MHRLVIALTALIGLTAGTYLLAYALLFAQGSDRAATLVPADAAAYLNVHLQPSTGQQAALEELLGRLPGFADDATLDEKVDQVAQNLVATMLGFDYRADVKPWLGQQVAAASWQTDAGGMATTVFAAVTDQDAAEASVARVLDPAGEAQATDHRGVTVQHAESATYAFVHGFLVLAPNEAAVRDVIDTSLDGGGLGHQPDFREAMERHTIDHLAGAYLDMVALGVEPSGLDGFRTAAAVVVAEEHGLRITGSAVRDADAAPSEDASASRPGGVTALLPPDTPAALTVFDAPGLFALLESALPAIPGTEPVTELLDAVRLLAALGLGLDLDADVIGLLEGEAGLALQGIEDGRPVVQIVVRPSDASATAERLEELVDGVVDAGGDERTESVDGVEVREVTLPQLGAVAYAVTDDAILIGLGLEQVRAVIQAGGAGSLADASRYADAFEALGHRSGNELYADLRPLLERLGVAESLPADARDILSRVGTLSLAMPSQPDRIDIHALLTIEDGGDQ